MIEIEIRPEVNENFSEANIEDATNRLRNKMTRAVEAGELNECELSQLATTILERLAALEELARLDRIACDAELTARKIRRELNIL